MEAETLGSLMMFPSGVLASSAMHSSSWGMEAEMLGSLMMFPSGVLASSPRAASDQTAGHRDVSLLNLDTHGLGKPLNDGEEREGGKHGSLVSLGVDDLAESVGAGGEPSAHIDTLQSSLAQRGGAQETQHLVLLL